MIDDDTRKGIAIMLKDCPFCGRTAPRIEKELVEISKGHPDIPYFVLKCRCGFITSDQALDGLIERWNRRPQAARMPSWRYSGGYGHKSEYKCSKCGKDIDVKDKYCRSCGRELTEY